MPRVPPLTTAVRTSVSERPVTGDGRTVHDTAVGAAIGLGVVLHCAVVPEHHVSRPPAETNLVLGVLDLPEQVAQQFLALRGLQPLDVCGENGSDEEALASCPGVGSYHRMGDRWEQLLKVTALFVRQQVALVRRRCEVVHRPQALQTALHLLGQVVVGGVGVGEERVAPGHGHLHHPQDRTERRVGDPVEVVMPDVLEAGVGSPLLQTDDVLGGTLGQERMLVDLAPVDGGGPLLVVGEFLPAEEQDLFHSSRARSSSSKSSGVSRPDRSSPSISAPSSGP